MHPQLAHIASELGTARERFRRLAAATPDAAWNERVDPNAWSVAECVAHLNITSREYEPKLRRAIADARAMGGGAPRRYRRSFFGWMISVTTGPMPGFGNVRFGRVKTPPTFVPSGDLPKDALVAEFERWHDVLVAFVREADDLPLDRTRMQSTFDTRVFYDAYSALVIVSRHQHRHLAQAERVNATRERAV